MRKFEDIKISVAGTGYVGMSIATLLAQHHDVTSVDVVPERVDMVNGKRSPIQDEYIEKYLREVPLSLKATLDAKAGYADADFVIIAAPTNYDPQKNYFDTSHVEEVIDIVREVNPHAIMVIKSTIPVGYCQRLYERYGKDLRLLFAPEFLRESKALYDNLYPSRIIVGTPKLFEVNNLQELEDAARIFAKLLQQAAIKEDIPTLFMGL
ncbi:MAG: UDP-glucose 6-dehydrogenase, partial [Paludibacteraceae bacterium]|nr:UDP-glucose 6-dehydrogenase [Paludibacteraceae bacterium]